MSGYENYPEITDKILLSKDGTYQTKKLLKLPYNPGHAGYAGFDYQCKHCKEMHNIAACPWLFYYRVAKD